MNQKELTFEQKILEYLHPMNEELWDEGVALGHELYLLFLKNPVLDLELTGSFVEKVKDWDSKLKAYQQKYEQENEICDP